MFFENLCLRLGEVMFNQIVSNTHFTVNAVYSSIYAVMGIIGLGLHILCSPKVTK
jgi:hypothetical protein